MARPAQYSHGRRMVMQVTMAGVLLATLGLAGLLARGRHASAGVELTDKPHLTDRLAIRLPEKWRVHQVPEESGIYPVKVVASEPARPSSVERTLVVYQNLVSGGTPADLLREALAGESGEFGRIEPFDVLSQSGVIAPFVSQVPIPHDRLGRVVQIPGWYAAAIVPGAGPEGTNLGIVIGVVGYATTGPPGQQAVRQVADGLSLRTH